MSIPDATSKSSGVEFIPFIPSPLGEKFSKITFGKISDDEIIQIYQAKKPKDIVREDFIDLFTKRKEVVQLDAATLMGYKLTASQLAHEVARILDSASRSFDREMQKAIYASYEIDDWIQGESSIMDEDHQFWVVGLGYGSIKQATCDFCDHVTGEQDYTFTNDKSKAELQISNIALHHIAAHEFFGVPGEAGRVNPEDVCKLLAVPKKEEGKY